MIGSLPNVMQSADLPRALQLCAGAMRYHASALVADPAHACLYNFHAVDTDILLAEVIGISERIA